MAIRRSLLLRWSWRDLRRRWGSVIVIAVIIAIGTGVYAGLGSTGRWRRMSNDASFEVLRMHDLRVSLDANTYVDEGALLALVDDLPAGSVASASERLEVPTQVDASTATEAVLVPGRLVGTDLAEDAGVDALHLDRGRLPSEGTEPPELVLEQKFADHYGLEPPGSAQLSGGRAVTFTGLGDTPEHFLVSGERDVAFLAEANYAVLFGALADVQRLSGLEGRVNDVVIRLVDGADRDAAESALESAVAALPGASATVETRDDDRAYQLLYDDIEGDQKVWNVLSALVLIAASLAAFNLVGRIVEAQRREIGMQMALGVPPARIAVRPLLVGAQIALLGTVLGVVVGLLVGAAMRSLLVEFLPLPIWRTPFQADVFAVAALLGFLIPFVASALPVRRAVRVEPVDAIRTAHQPARGRGLVRLSHRVKLPGNSLAQLPLRNLMRSPRRTVLTAVGVGAAIAALVGVVGMLDSFRATIARGEDEIVQDLPDRVMVQLDGLVLADGAEVTALTSSPLVARGDASLELPATVRSAADADAEPLDLFVEVLDLEGAAWTPTVDDPAPATEGPGVVISRKAAADLGVGTGDAVIVRHPAQADTGGLAQVDTQMTVVGLHPNPIRALAFVDVADRDQLSIPPLANRVDLAPADGVSTDELRRAMFETPGVASAQPVAALTGVFDEALEQFLGFLVLTAGAVLVMALLIAFNSTSIAVDERTREHATLFAFGLPVRRVVWMVVKENVIVGLLATVVGVGLGYLLVRWMVSSIVASTVPDFGFDVVIEPATVVVALAIGIVAVALTPVLMSRRLRRLDIPDALRVME